MLNHYQKKYFLANISKVIINTKRHKLVKAERFSRKQNL